MTSPAQIAKADLIAAELQAAIVIAKVVRDDFNNYGSFRVFIDFRVLNESHRGHWFADKPNFRKIGWIIKRIIKKHSVIVEFVNMPRMQYEVSQGERYKLGYDRNNIYMDFTVPEIEVQTEKPREIQLTL